MKLQLKVFITLLLVGFIAWFYSCRSTLPSGFEEILNQMPTEITYNNDVQPILADRCFSCHGPDANTRKANLRLDLEPSAKSALNSGAGKAILEGKPHRSALITRVFSEDPELIMPPPESNLSLSENEKAILYTWIKNGAQYEEHWAFLPIQKSSLPDKSKDTYDNPIDRFIGSKLNEKGLSFSKKASRERLIRRVTMDLTGLPPTLEEIDAFVTNNDENAYANLVDNLLSSDRYGERMAMEWMDVARYADSHGLHADGYRMMWPWRNWVIDAFNQNLGYDQFVTWQLAGDLMDSPTDDQKLATAFNRNHAMTAEGGVIDEEVRLNYVYDRTETFATAFLGLTVGCARCHDHKFDPISQKEFYQLAAFFNNVKELGMTGDDGNYGPMLTILDESAKQELARIEISIENHQASINKNDDVVSEIKQYIDKIKLKEPLKKRIFYGPIESLKGDRIDRKRNFTTNVPRKLTQGKYGTALKLTGEYDELYIKNITAFNVDQPFSTSLWINPTKRDSAKTQTLMGTTGEKNNFWRGWDFFLDSENKLHVRLIHSLPHNYLEVASKDSVSLNTWTQVAFTYDGSGSTRGIKLYKNGEKIVQQSHYDKLYKNIIPVTVGTHLPEPKRAIRVGKSYRNYTGEYGTFKGLIDDIKIYNDALTDLEVLAASKINPTDLSSTLKQDHLVQYHYKTDAEKKKLRRTVREKINFYDDKPEVMVMEEMPKPRKAYLYNRGEYTQPTEEVFPMTPSVLHDFPEDLPKNRLGLATWLFDQNNPLVARVTVNRYWQMIFGKGLVSSTNDFGLQGSKPSHPKLLDHLATELVKESWDIKSLIRKMVLSHTYRQASQATEETLAYDPENKWLARAPSYRYQAEFIRDNALAAAGILTERQGGESVKPYQPEGLWIEKSSFSHVLLNYKESEGEDLYRRSLYTFIRRTSPPPVLTIFDTPNREICTVKRENTNTPLQALVLLNDPQFVEAGRMLAERVMMEGGAELEDQLVYAFRLTTGRIPAPKELQILSDLYDNQFDLYQRDRQAARKLLAVGELSRNLRINSSRAAAMTVVANTLLNHNETYIKR